MSADPWAAAEAQQAQASSGNGQQQGGSQVMPQGGQGLGGGALFGGGGRSKPSLFNATHPAGTVRQGKIVDIRDVHSRTHAREGGELRYWPNGVTGKGTKPVTQATGADGKPNRPVMDVHIILDTEYRLSDQERKELSREDYEDDGQRSYVVQDLKGFQDAIKAFNQQAAAAGRNVLTNQADLIGKTLEVKRLAEPRQPQKWAERIS